MKECPELPGVLKISWPHAGYGKIRIQDEKDFYGLKSVVSVHDDYSVIEPLIKSKYELRISFIKPNHYRVHKRFSMNWKVNYGSSNMSEFVDMNPKWKRWVDIIVKEYPDLDLFAIDAIIDTEGKEYILELNGSSQGFNYEHEEEDLMNVRDLALSRIRKIVNKDYQEEPQPVLSNEELNNKIQELQSQKKELDNQLITLKQNEKKPQKQNNKLKLKIFIMLAFSVVLLAFTILPHSIKKDLQILELFLVLIFDVICCIFIYLN